MRVDPIGEVVDVAHAFMKAHVQRYHDLRQMQLDTSELDAGPARDAARKGYRHLDGIAGRKVQAMKPGRSSACESAAVGEAPPDRAEDDQRIGSNLLPRVEAGA